MISLALLSTLAMLVAVDDRRARWWVLYAASSCFAVYSHYTAVFVLGAQLVWVLWAHPESRRPALIANAGAAVGFLPWLSGLIADLNSPTTRILGALDPFNLDTVKISLERWSVGYPYKFVGLRSMPGTIGLILISAGVALAIVAIAVRWRRRPPVWFPRMDRRLALIVALALAAPVGEAAVSLVGNDIFGDTKPGGIVACLRPHPGRPGQCGPIPVSHRVGGPPGRRIRHRCSEDAGARTPAS